MLRQLSPQLDAWAAPAPPRELVQRTLGAARAELRAERAVAGLPAHVVAAGFERELLRLLAAAAPALLVAVAWNLLVLLRGPALLDAWMPSLLAWALPVAYVLGAAGWLALVLGSLPVLAHRRAHRRVQEALA